ncbi:hypothetical protein ABEB36_008597 [Hypothenemus hampei]|uniref:Sperm flagellar protein 2 n=1 Tax=Hypothenemus hampei TaxID=57062 RepID=A0ABD1EMG1_HYPHA
MSLHLFYQVFLEVQFKNKLDYLTEKELETQLGKRISRFYAKTVNECEDPNKFTLHRRDLCEPFLAGGDVYHWYKDRMESLQSRCKDARDAYIHHMKNHFDNEPNATVKESGFLLARGLNLSSWLQNANDTFSFELPHEDLSLLDQRSYEELIRAQEVAQKQLSFEPDLKEAKKIVKNLRSKSKMREENKIFKYQLQQEIMNAFDNKINDDKGKTSDDLLTKILLKQSFYEKELVSKVAQVKLHKQYMLDNKRKQGDILQKVKDKQFLDALILQNKDLNEIKLTYYLELERIVQLHKIIWEEKKKLRAKRHKDICAQAVSNMVDMAVKLSEYKKRYGREMNEREMSELRNVFVTSQPIFDSNEPAMQILIDERPPEEIITRENVLDNKEFETYIEYSRPWELKNADIDSETFQQICYGLNILGFRVHKALQTKHPIIPLTEKPDFPETTIRVCINGLQDTSILPILRQLLSERNIHVIELSQAINFCLEAYKMESKREYDEDNGSMKEVKQKKDKKPKPKKGEKLKKNKKKHEEGEHVPTLIQTYFDNKMVQTPIKFPCEEIPYTLSAVLGKTAQELLDEGQPLEDFLLITMFVEYLKSLPNLNGWALVNYPTTFEQAAILEEIFTGVKLLDPNEKIPKKTLSEIFESDPVADEDVHSLYNVGNRLSRLLPNPVIPETPKVYDTILTAYIKIRKMPYEDKVSNPMLPPSYEELGNEPDPLDKFYSNAGANYSLYYKDFDPTTVKYLGKLIIGDYTLPLKSSLEIFGNVDMDYKPAKDVKATRKGKKLKNPLKKMAFDAATEKPITKSKMGKKGKAQVVIVYENKAIQVPSEEEEEFVDVNLSVLAPESPVPGQEGWEYCLADCPEELLTVLATLWEAVEEIYINDMKQVFFLKRCHLRMIMPFVEYVKCTMKKAINQPDYKSAYLAKFQMAFNEFDMEFRRDDEFKAEMHCRIEEFKEKLKEMSDIKMMTLEGMRCKIIGANWSPQQILELLNDFVNMIQIELDRCIESIRFINDYYMGACSGLPSDDGAYKEDLLPKFHIINYDIINSMFENINNTVDLTYFNQLFSHLLQKVSATIKKLNTISSNFIEKTGSRESTYKPKSGTTSPKSKASKNTKKSRDDQGVMKQNMDKLLAEWQSAIHGETLRVMLRIDLIKFNALQCIEEFLNTIQQAFHEIYNDIRDRYQEEFKNIEAACNVFKFAVEKEQPVQKELLFEDQNFRIKLDVNLFNNPLIIPELSPEVVEEGAFTIAQLSKLVDILLELSPSGYMPRATFIFLLQDITCENFHSDKSPKLWRKLATVKLAKIVDALFDDLEYVYWKDFIVYNLRLKFPSERELLLTRRTFKECDPDGTELVQDYQFYSNKLWFEYAFKFDDSQKIISIKKLLLKMYYIRGHGLSYTALLLDFCKGDNCLQGFVKALELSIGKFLCWHPDKGQMFVEEYFRRIQQHEENVRIRDKERAEHYKIVCDVINKLIDDIIHICDKVVIEDVTKTRSILKKSSEEEEENNNDDANIEPRTSEEKEKHVIVPKIFPDNVETECDEYGETLFFLTLEPVIAIITAALPWHSRVRTLEEASYWETAAQIFESCRNPKFNMSVLSHEFLNTEPFTRLLALTKKFHIIDPVRVVNDIMSQ